MDAVLGLASFVSESEMPGSAGRARTRGHFEPESKPKYKPPTKQPAPKPKQKPMAPPPAQKKPVPSSHVQPSYQLPMGYPFNLANYLYTFMDKSQPMMSLMPGLTVPPQGMYPPYGMMYQQPMYGTPGWPLNVTSPAPVLATSTQQSRLYKRSARHVAIAFFIRTEEGKRKASETGTPAKYARFM